MRIYWATKLRGFFRHMSHRMTSVEFLEANNYYETPSLLTRFKSKVIHNPMLDPLGIFQIVDVRGKDCDAYGSFNRFLNADKPYFLYLENPVALYHYALGRIRFKVGRKKFQACLNDPNLKYIVCMSEACRSTFERINMPIPECVKMETIYPFVPDNPHISPEEVQRKCRNEYLECLYCVQGIRFVSKGGLEVLSAYENLRRSGVKIHLTVITKLSDLELEVKRRLQQSEEISLYDFDFTYDELERIYAKTNVLLQPSSDDSFGLTILESLKGGCAVICSRLYGFSEMVEDGDNGFLVEPKFWFFDRQNIPNPAVWNHRKRTIYSHKESPELVAQLQEKLEVLCNDRDLLTSMSLNSLHLGSTKFGEERICSAWDAVWKGLENE